MRPFFIPTLFKYLWDDAKKCEMMSVLFLSPYNIIKFCAEWEDIKELEGITHDTIIIYYCHIIILISMYCALGVF